MHAACYRETFVRIRRINCVTYSQQLSNVLKEKSDPMFASPLQRLLPMDKSVFSGVCGQGLATAAVAVAFEKNLNAAKKPLDFIMTRLICTGTLTRSRSLMSPCCKAVKGVSRKHTGNLFFYCLLTEAVRTLNKREYRPFLKS